MYIPALTMVGVSFAGCHDLLVLTLMVATVGFNGAVLSGQWTRVDSGRTIRHKHVGFLLIRSTMNNEQ